MKMQMTTRTELIGVDGCQLAGVLAGLGILKRCADEGVDGGKVWLGWTVYAGRYVPVIEHEIGIEELAEALCRPVGEWAVPAEASPFHLAKRGNSGGKMTRQERFLQIVAGLEGEIDAERMLDMLVGRVDWRAEDERPGVQSLNLRIDRAATTRAAALRAGDEGRRINLEAQWLMALGMTCFAGDDGVVMPFRMWERMPIGFGVPLDEEVKRPMEAVWSLWEDAVDLDGAMALVDLPGAGRPRFAARRQLVGGSWPAPWEMSAGYGVGG